MTQTYEEAKAWRDSLQSTLALMQNARSNGLAKESNPNAEWVQAANTAIQICETQLEDANKTVRAYELRDKTERVLAEAAPPPARVRNEAACCGNCPYFCGPMRTSGYGACALNPPDAMGDSPKCHENNRCGKHPNFWKES